MSLSRTVLLPTGLAMTFGFGLADVPLRLSLTIRNHRFEPAELRVQAGRPVVIEVTNGDATAEVFDSPDLGIETVIAGGCRAAVRIPAMKPGRYAFTGEFHAATAAAVLVVDG